MQWLADCGPVYTSPGGAAAPAPGALRLTLIFVPHNRQEGQGGQGQRAVPGSGPIPGPAQVEQLAPERYRGGLERQGDVLEQPVDDVAHARPAPRPDLQEEPLGLGGLGLAQRHPVVGAERAGEPGVADVALRLGGEGLGRALEIDPSYTIGSIAGPSLVGAALGDGEPAGLNQQRFGTADEHTLNAARLYGHGCHSAYAKYKSVR